MSLPLLFSQIHNFVYELEDTFRVKLHSERTCKYIWSVTKIRLIKKMNEFILFLSKLQIYVCFMKYV